MHFLLDRCMSVRKYQMHNVNFNIEIATYLPRARVARLPARMVLLQKIFENEQKQHHYLRVQKRSIDARAEYFASFPRGLAWLAAGKSCSVLRPAKRGRAGNYLLKIARPSARPTSNTAACDSTRSLKLGVDRGARVGRARPIMAPTFFPLLF